MGCLQLTDSERKQLSEIGAKLGKKALEEIATIARPDTILPVVGWQSGTTLSHGLGGV
jgi:hypothetical protein